ncbi:MAG: tryptophan--tRNA ligase, partial [Lepagella sp.]
LMRTASFKDKARKALGIVPKKEDEADNIECDIVGNETTSKRVNAGLLTYPTLMAVDILIHHADFVPVGKDQEQHLELTRRFGRRFNAFYGVDYFSDPVNFNFGGKAVKVPGLDGSGKMGKSEGNCIYLIDDEKTLRKKVMRAVTDAGPQAPDSPVSEPVANLFSLMELVSEPSTLQHFKAAYADCSIRYGDLKKQLAEDILKVTLPIRERILEIRDDEAYLGRIARHGAEHARETAAKTLAEVKHIMGIRPLG